MKYLYPFFLAIFLVSCGPSDEQISKNVNTTLAGSGRNISAHVENGIVTLTGECPDESCKNVSETAVKNVKGVKQVVNNITVAPPPPPPVTINPNDSLNISVNELLEDYPGVKGSVSNGVVTLTGEIKRSHVTNLMQKLSAVKPKKIVNKLQIK